MSPRPGPRWSDLTSQELHRHVEAGEAIVAEGRFEEVQREDHSAWGYVLVTDTRLLLKEKAGPASLPFASVISYAEKYHGDRYYLRLHHEPISRTRFRRKWKIGFILIGANSHRPWPERFTAFRFSRRDTAAATAIRAELERRGVNPTDWRRDLPEPYWPPSLFEAFRRSG